MLDHIDTDRFEGERVGVAYGGRSPERPVSLETGQALADALRSLDYEVAEYDFPEDLDVFVDDPPSVVLVAFHGGSGENGTIQGFFETLGVPYTGSGVLSSALALDKGRSKALFERASIMTPACDRMPLDEAADLDRNDFETWIERRDLSSPAVVKPNDGGSSQGVAICESVDEMFEAVGDIAEGAEETASSGVLVEEYVDGPEYTVGLFDGECLGSLEVIPGEEFYNYEAKYESDETQYEIVDEPGLVKRLEAAGRLAYETLGCRGVARMDFVAGTRRGDQVLYALEANTIPGMTSTSLVPKLAKDQGISFAEFAELMISAATCESPIET